MATQPPRTATMKLPPWLWGGAVEHFLADAHLRAVPSTGSGNDRPVEVGTVERLARADPHLVRVTDVINPAGDPRPHVLAAAEQQQHPIPLSITPQQVKGELQQMFARLEPAGRIGLLAPTFSLLATQATFAPADRLLGELHAARDALLAMRVAETNGPVFPAPSVHFLQRSPALLHRRGLSAVLLRPEQDERLKAGDLSQLATSLGEGDLVFSSSTDLGDGLFLFDAYLAPLLGAMTPFVWAFPATRASGSGTLIFNLGRPISGTFPAALEALQLLPSRTPRTTQNAPPLPARAGPAALHWWAKRLDKLLAVLSDPAVFAASDGTYVPIKQVQALLSAEQVFRRVAAIQQLHRNPEARRVLLYSTLDTIDRLSNRRLTQMCDLRVAEETLGRLRQTMSSDVAAVLLPAADRAVQALREVQQGFFITQQLGATQVEYSDPEGNQHALDLADAAAEYIRLLRNATHGHGTNRPERRTSTNALLAHHNGSIPDDLPLLAYLYFLDLLINADRLRRILHHGAG